MPLLLQLSFCSPFFLDCYQCQAHWLHGCSQSANTQTFLPTTHVLSWLSDSDLLKDNSIPAALTEWLLWITQLLLIDFNILATTASENLTSFLTTPLTLMPLSSTKAKAGFQPLPFLLFLWGCRKELVPLATVLDQSSSFSLSSSSSTNLAEAAAAKCSKFVVSSSTLEWRDETWELLLLLLLPLLSLASCSNPNFCCWSSVNFANLACLWQCSLTWTCFKSFGVWVSCSCFLLLGPSLGHLFLSFPHVLTSETLWVVSAALT